MQNSDSPPVAEPPPPTPGSSTQSPGGDTIDFPLCKPGDVIHGFTIQDIFGVDDAYIVFLSTTGRLRCEVAEMTPVVKRVMTEYGRVSTDNRTRLRQVYDREFLPIAAAGILAGLCAPSELEVPQQFDLARAFILEHSPIGDVFEQTPDFAVFLDKANHLQWRHRALPQALVPAIAAAERLLQAGAATLSRDEQAVLRGILGAELASSFRAGVADPKDFAASTAFLDRRLEAVTRTRYVRNSIYSAVALGFPLWLAYLMSLYFHLPGEIYWLGAAGGVVGAALSILQRGATLRVAHFASLHLIEFQGTSRVLLGLVFGLLVAVAVTADFLLGTLGRTNEGLFLLSVAGGLSERFVPDLLSRIISSSKEERPGLKPPGPSTTNGDQPVEEDRHG